jgi:hypothetical protein
MCDRPQRPSLQRERAIAVDAGAGRSSLARLIQINALASGFGDAPLGTIQYKCSVNDAVSLLEQAARFKRPTAGLLEPEAEQILLSLTTEYEARAFLLLASIRLMIRRSCRSRGCFRTDSEIAKFVVP